MNERPKSREETPKEGSDTTWRVMPRCNNMSLRRTKSKIAMTSRGNSETLMHMCHGIVGNRLLRPEMRRPTPWMP